MFLLKPLDLGNIGGTQVIDLVIQLDEWGEPITAPLCLINVGTI